MKFEKYTRFTAVTTPKQRKLLNDIAHMLQHGEKRTQRRFTHNSVLRALCTVLQSEMKYMDFYHVKTEEDLTRYFSNILGSTEKQKRTA